MPAGIRTTPPRSEAPTPHRCWRRPCRHRQEYTCPARNRIRRRCQKRSRSFSVPDGPDSPVPQESQQSRAGLLVANRSPNAARRFLWKAASWTDSETFGLVGAHDAHLIAPVDRDHHGIDLVKAVRAVCPSSSRKRFSLAGGACERSDAHCVALRGCHATWNGCAQRPAIPRRVAPRLAATQRRSEAARREAASCWSPFWHDEPYTANYDESSRRDQPAREGCSSRDDSTSA